MTWSSETQFDTSDFLMRDYLIIFEELVNYTEVEGSLRNFMKVLRPFGPPSPLVVSSFVNNDGTASPLAPSRIHYLLKGNKRRKLLNL